VDFELTTEQRDLGDVVQRMASERRDFEAVADDPHGVLETSWQDLAQSLQLGGLLIAEDADGFGAGMLDAAVVSEELGAALFGSAFLVSGVAVPLLLATSASDSARALLRELADGKRTAVTSLAPDPGAQLDVSDDGAVRVSGRVPSVLALRSADVLVLPATLGATPGIVTVLMAHDAVAVHDVEASDLSRPLVDVELTAAPGEWLPADAPALERARASIAVGLAAELCGVARAAMQMSIGHAKQREQFGHAIGSYQAIKHMCADMLVAVEGARACTTSAAWHLDAGHTDATELAGAALVKAREAARLCSATNIQIHGAIGYTWEHDAHHYYRRAVSARSSMIAGDEAIAWLIGDASSSA
jgi:alkylation response protein AidB-like acyl-CoA dehydrogenase